MGRVYTVPQIVEWNSDCMVLFTVRATKLSWALIADTSQILLQNTKCAHLSSLYCFQTVPDPEYKEINSDQTALRHQVALQVKPGVMYQGCAS